LIVLRNLMFISFPHCHFVTCTRVRSCPPAVLVRDNFPSSNRPHYGCVSVCPPFISSASYTQKSRYRLSTSTITNIAKKKWIYKKTIPMIGVFRPWAVICPSLLGKLWRYNLMISITIVSKHGIITSVLGCIFRIRFNSAKAWTGLLIGIKLYPGS